MSKNPRAKSRLALDTHVIEKGNSCRDNQGPDCDGRMDECVCLLSRSGESAVFQQQHHIEERNIIKD